MDCSKRFCCYLCAFIIIVFSFSSCTVVKNYPKEKYFVYENVIKINGNISKDEKKRLTTELENYWDDSLHARRVQQFVAFEKLKNPPVFDTANIVRTQTFMQGYLNSQGYYHIEFSNPDSSYRFYEKKDQKRTVVTMTIDPGKNTIIDSFYFDFKDSLLQKLSTQNMDKSLVRVSTSPFSKQLIAAELDRLTNLFRQNGFFELRRDNLFAEIDTSNLSLLKLSLDPAEIALKIAEANDKRKQNPTCIVRISEKSEQDTILTAADSIHFKQYFVGHVYYFPETDRFESLDLILQDTTGFKREDYKNYSLFYRQGLFSYKTFRGHTYQKAKELYNESKFYKTLNTYNLMGPWERIDYRTVIKKDSVDFYYFLTPYKKQKISFNFEMSRNTGDFLSSSTLIGISQNTNYINRNVWRRAIQSSTLLSNGVEFSLLRTSSLLQTFQSSISHSYSFPRLWPIRAKRGQILDLAKTQLTVSASYTERKDYFRIRSLNTGLAYTFRKRGPTWQVRFPNIEINILDTLPLLDSAINTNPFLRTAFNTGSVVGTQANVVWTWQARKTAFTHFLRLSGEQSGVLLGRIPSLQDKIYQFVKFEAEYRHIPPTNRNTISLRLFGGIGYSYSKAEKFGKNMPFFKQFVAGGPNSMRAWGLRLLGLGSSIVSDTSSVFRDRYGDFQLEANAEYRYMIAEFSSVKVGGALFLDMGNIWNLSEDSLTKGSKFSFKNFDRDIAIGVGTGLRFDFSFFLVRVDLGIKLKDPARSINNGWLTLSDFTWKNYEHSIKDPVTGKYQPPTRSNFAIQLGIGLPF